MSAADDETLHAAVTQDTDRTPVEGRDEALPGLEADPAPDRPKRPRRPRAAASSTPGDKPARERKDRAPRAPRAPRTTPLRPRLTEAIGGLGLVVSVFDAYDGQVILAGADQLATSLDALAKENDNVRRALESALTGSAWGGVLFAATAIALPIMAHHGLVPAQLGALGPPGTPPPAPPAPPQPAPYDYAGPIPAGAGL